LEAYLRFGVSCLEHLIGAFSLAIWDEQKQRFFVARDQMGVKPLSYYWHKGFFAFATQRKSIAAWPQVDKSADWRFLFQSMSSLGFPRDSTNFKHIRYLSPGHYLLVDQHGVERKKYWELDLDQRVTHRSDADYVAEFRHHFEQAIACRMEANTPIGTHLSGGLDSSGITAFAHQFGQKSGIETKALSYGVERDHEGELKLVEENLKAYDLLDHLDIHHKFINVTEPIERTFRKFVEHEAQCCDGLSQSNNVNTEFEIQSAAQQHGLGVVLSGFPGDELVTSFCRPFYLEYFDRGEYLNFFFKKLKSRHTWKHRMRAFAAASAVKWSPGQSEKMAIRYARWRYDIRKYKARSFFLNRDYFEQDHELASVLEPQHLPMAHRAFPTSLRAYQRNHVCRPHSHRRMESEQLSALHWKLEYRYPMMDIRLLQYMISIPMEQKISQDMSRRIFRLGMKDYLPDSIRLRDVKTAGSLKPMSKKRKPMTEDDSKFALWNEIKEAKCSPFLNHEMVEKWLDSKRSPFGMYPWMVLAQLGLIDRIHY